MTNNPSSTWPHTYPTDSSTKNDQVMARRSLLFDRIMSLPSDQWRFRNALMALWYPCFDAEAIDLAMQQLTAWGTEGEEEANHRR